MMDPSRHALRAETLSKYFKNDYSAPSSRYYTEDGKAMGYWQGELAKEIGLHGLVTEEQFNRLVRGQDPITGEQLLSFTARENASQRAGWDLTINAPKGVSAAAIIGGDDRIVVAHREANRITMQKMEQWAQQKMGGNNAAVTTGKLIIATFEHSAARPVDGYSAVHLHSHNIVMNMTALDGSGQARALETSTIYAAQKYATAVYRAELAVRLKSLGYELSRGEKGEPELKGFTKEYLQSESARSQLIQQRMKERGLVGRESESMIAHEDREGKLKQSPEEIKAMQKVHAEAYGNQPQKVVQAALDRGTGRELPDSRGIAMQAVSYARHKLSERDAVFSELEVVSQALHWRKSMGNVTTADIEKAFKEQIDSARFVQVHHVREGRPDRQFTTAEMLAKERAFLEWAMAGKGQALAIAPSETLDRFKELSSNEKRKQVLLGYLKSTDQVTTMRGGAGTGKSSALGTIAKVATENGYEVKGLAPVSKAVAGLAEKGINAMTLQKFVHKNLDVPAAAPRRLYLVDEMSLAATDALEKFSKAVRPQDKVIFVGDERQHKPVQAGFLFGQMQEVGIQQAQLNKNYRQKEPVLKQAVNLMAAGRIAESISLLDKNGHVQAFTNRDERFSAIADAYAANPTRNVIVSPDHESRKELNRLTREALQAHGHLQDSGYKATQFVGKDTYEIDKREAKSYAPGDMVKFEKAIRDLAIPAKAHGEVIATDQAANTVTIRVAGAEHTIEAGRLKDVGIYERKMMDIAAGERVQFTAPWKGFSNRDTGTVRTIDASGNALVEMDKGKAVRIRLAENPHIDYAYAMTSHAIQGDTTREAIVHMEATNTGLDKLIHRTFGYVGSSRPEYKLTIFTDDKDVLVHRLSREHVKHQALSKEQVRELGRHNHQQQAASA